MGLFIGASILTVLEILDYIYEVHYPYTAPAQANSKVLRCGRIRRKLAPINSWTDCSERCSTADTLAKGSQAIVANSGFIEL